MKKQSKKTTAAMLAAAMTFGMVNVMPAYASPALADPPDWVPTDAQGAVDFLNEYGSTYVTNEYVAFCFPVHPEAADGGGTAVIKECTAAYSLVQNTTLRYSCPYDFSEEEEPDYSLYPGKERYTVEQAYREWLAAHDKAYEFYLWHLESEGTFSFQLQRDLQMPDTGHIYSFICQDTDVVTETDLFGWMPDSPAEFNRYLQQYGGVSRHDNYVVCAGVVNYSTGAEMNITTYGEGQIGEFLHNYCSPVLLGERPTGNPSYVFQYAQAQAPGDLTVVMDINIPWAPEDAKNPYEIGRFLIGDDMMIYDYQEPYIIPHEIPNWVPSSYDEALEFNDTYGKTLIKDGYVCLCIPYRTIQDESYVLVNNLDPNTVQASSVSTLLEMRYHLNTQVDGPQDSYYVHVFQPQSDGLIDLSFCRCDSKLRTDVPPTETVLWNFTFAVQGDQITETDIYGWAPDCSKEFDTWLEENGALAVHGEYLVSAGLLPIYPVHVELTPTGTAAIEPVLEFAPECGSRYLQAPGTPARDIWIYRATKPGELTVRRALCYDEGFEYEGQKILELDYGYYEVDDSLNFHPVKVVNGDISGDGIFNVADIVGMTEFLHGVLQLNEEQLLKADFNKDNRINAIDLTQMKRTLLLEATIRPTT